MHASSPPPGKACFWLAECRTPELLVSLAAKYPDIASRMAASRPLLRFAIKGNQEQVQRLLREEEDKEKELDRQYWAPLKAELEAWRRRNKQDG
ncbi:MAG: hypothetical protein AB1797_08105 [bacterium]